MAPGRPVVEFELRRTTIWCHSSSTTIKEETMKYLCLVYIDEKKLDALSKSELDALAIKGKGGLRWKSIE
jgi:hypothetical protein